MAAASLALIAVPDAFKLADAVQQAGATATPVDANQAQGAPAPVDTVTLTNQAAEGQLTGQNPNAERFDPPAFVGAAGLFFGANTAQQNAAGTFQTAPALPTLLPEPQNAPAAAPANAPDAANTAANQDPPANAANAAAAGAGANAANANDPAAAGDTPPLELQQLDQALLQLGVNPESIPVAQQLAMLLYANDPAALQLLVQALQNTATQQGGTQTGANTAANNNTGATQAILQTATQPNQGQQTQAVPAIAPGVANALSTQIGELQIAIQAVEIQAPQQANTAAAGATGTSLNVTA